MSIDPNFEIVCIAYRRALYQPSVQRWYSVRQMCDAAKVMAANADAAGDYALLSRMARTHARGILHARDQKEEEICTLS